MEMPTPKPFSEKAQEAIDDAESFYNMKKPSAGTGYYCGITTTGACSQKYINAGCFGNLLSWCPSSNIVSVVMHPRLAESGRINKVCTKKEYKEKVDAYVDWLTNRSIWANLFAVKNPEGAFVLNVTGMDRRFIGSGMSAARYTGEYSARVESWYKMKDFVGEELAFVLMHYTWPESKDKKVTWTVNAAHYWCDHNFVAGSRMSDVLFEGFLSRNLLFQDRLALTNSLSKDREHASLFRDVGRNPMSKPLELPPVSSKLEMDGFLPVQRQRLYLNENRLESWAKDFVKLNNMEKYL